MPRKPLIRTDKYPYHVYARANNKDNFPLPTKDTWRIFTRQLLKTKIEFNLDLLCFVLMDNHYHILLRTPERNLDLAMQNLNRNISLEIGKKTGRINRIFGSRYKWSLIEKQTYFINVYRYIYQNPLRAKIVEKVQDYPYHSQNKDIPKQLQDLTPLFFDRFKSPDEYLDWMNHYDQNATKETRRGLRKTTFKPVYDRTY